jgi:starvation-inducible DNA-binding protein
MAKKKSVTSGGPVSAPAIDIGIDARDREKVAEALSRLLADTFSLYLKTHSFHWNVEGPMFNTLHLMFMDQYTELWNALDAIAERIRSLGYPAPGSSKAFAKLASIAEVDGPRTGQGPRGGRAHRPRRVRPGGQGGRRVVRGPAHPAPAGP